MNFKTLQIFFWVTFGLSLIILPLNIGLGLIALGLVIIPILILHIRVGINLNKIEDHKLSIILSSLNIIIFALVRPDGAHAITDNGLSSVLGIFGISGGFDTKYENHFFVASLVLLLAQVIIDIRLRKLIRRAKAKK